MEDAGLRHTINMSTRLTVVFKFINEMLTAQPGFLQDLTLSSVAAKWVLVLVAYL
jgi:hypothetical protein